MALSITCGVANAASTIASGRTVTPQPRPSLAGCNMNVLGADPEQVVVRASGGSFPSNIAFLPLSRYPNLYSLGTYNCGGTWSAEFITDSDKFDFQCQVTSAGSSFRLWVDGVQYSRFMVPFTTYGATADGNLYRTLVNFGARGPRRIRLDFCVAPLVEFTVSQRTSLAKPTDKGWTRRCVVALDSLGVGVKTGGENTQPQESFVMQGARAAGFEDVWNQSEGGRGYVSRGDAPDTATLSLGECLPIDVYPYDPDMTLIGGTGYNDWGKIINGTSTQVEIVAEAVAVFEGLKTNLPRAKHIIIGCYMPGGAGATMIALNTALKTEAENAGLYYVDMVGEGWLTGIPTDTSGNAQWYVGPDSVHMTEAGDDYMAVKLTSHLYHALQS